MNNVVTDILYLHHKKLDCYAGDYTNFLKVREEQFKAQKRGKPLSVPPSTILCLAVDKIWLRVFY